MFLGLLRHRKAARVAQDLGLTQSAISQALKRLREIFKDDLFLRLPHGMGPTAAALALEAPVRAAVDSLRGALGALQSFDPAQASGVLRLAAMDAEQAVLIPALSARLCREAPGLRLSVLPLARAQAVQALIDGQVDLVLGVWWDRPESILDQTLYHESYRVVGSAEMLPDAPHIDLAAYCAADHVLVSPAGDLHGIVDQQLAQMGRSRRVVLGLPAFLPALVSVAEAPALVTLPARLAEALAPRFGLVVAKPPLPVRSFPVSAYWHRRNQSNPQTRWLTDQLSASMSGAPAEQPAFDQVDGCADDYAQQ